MRRFAVAVVLAMIMCASLQAQAHMTIAQRFQFWGNLEANQKMIFLTGWTNGFFRDLRADGFLPFAQCLEDKMTVEQAIAMVNKYYAANPEKWSLPIGDGIVQALTIKAGPCASSESLAR